MQAPSAFFVDQCQKDGFNVFMSPEKMAQLSFREGQVVRIKTQSKESILVKLYSSKEECPIANIQIPRAVRNNIHCFLGQTVVVEAAEKVAKADDVIISAVSETIDGIDGSIIDLLYASNYDFVGMPIRRDQIIPVYALNRVIEFKVVNCSPEEEVIIQDKEVILYRNQPIHRENINFSTVSYDSIGGLHKQIDQIRKLIEFPLLQPKLVSSFGVRPSSGILITGQSGSGKSYVARAISNETPCHFEYIKAIDLLTKSPNDAAFILKRFVDRVYEKAPSILFIDDIDLICDPISLTDTATDNHLSNALLSAIDRCIDNPRVVFIGTAKSADSIPKDFKRSRRLDKVIEFPMPDRQGRVEIIRCSIKNTLLHSATTPEDLEQGTEGLSAGEIARTCQMALVHRAMEIVQSQNSDADVSIEVLQSLVVGKRRFQKLLPNGNKDFGSPQKSDDPFAFADEKPPAKNDDPFGGMSVAGQKKNNDDPFSGMKASKAKNDDDPFAGMSSGSAPSKKDNDDPFAGMSTKSSDPFGNKSSANDDPFGAPAKPAANKSADPFGNPAASDDPFSVPSNNSKKSDDPFADSDNPFGAPKKADAKPKSDDPFGAPKAQKSADPFGNNDDPFGIPAKPAEKKDNDDPFGAPKAAKSSDPFGNNDDPFGTPKQDNKKSADPFGNNDNPFGAPKAAKSSDPFGNNDDPFGTPKQDNKKSADPFGNNDDPFGAPKAQKDESDPFGAPKSQKSSDPFGAPAAAKKDDASDPFGAPKAQKSADPFGNNNNDDPFGAPTKPAAKADDDPFSAKPAPKGSSDPFGAPSANSNGNDDPFAAKPAQKNSSDPFGNGNDPFGGPSSNNKPQNSSDPFGAPSGKPQNSSDPFGNDPFAAPPSNNKSQGSSDPFGNGNDPFGNSKPQNSSDPFGGPSNDPFGNPSNNSQKSGNQPNNSSDPFAAPSNKPQNSSDPFGNDPFGSSAKQPQNSSDPFGSSSNNAGGGFDPFGSQSSAGQPKDPFAGMQKVDLKQATIEDKKKQQQQQPQQPEQPQKKVINDPFAPRRKK
ncbi:ATPase, AAA family protein [Trichomonas vaginalis G3]|uniref:ATPase, AAA family protein n=1 Tax=Trichomonas vaginalis (strain ATCC PRA-98 / G3) TaxID=412133 RepID=A2FTG5_TRIV3|nr:ATP binding [Trichomonas vaginalis G3]EAX91815.1 ATPase, AAA family protein [Trichomonas vaginalis G3]KAI5538266.1 ATP binding [Trichomonas vaginalis G3]|eukprot:XP_001304745.1 ATPase, AAA family protein [Trichomonas vaginalis G3]